MCKSKRQGGQRCAAHTRAAYQRACKTFDGTAIAEAAIQYASTKEGRAVLLAEAHEHIAAGRFEAAAEANSFVQSGDAVRAANIEAATLIGNWGPVPAPDLDRPYVVAIDLDGTIAMGYNEAVHAELVAMGALPRDSVCDPKTYDLAEAFGVDRVLVDEAIARASAAGTTYQYANPDTVGIAALNALHAKGAYTKVVTARSIEHGGARTLQWLAQKSGLKFDEVVHTHNKHEVEYDLLVDDAPFNVENLVNRGRGAVLKDRSWNRDADHLPRLVEWSDLAEAVKASRVS